jgi:hypothetical protein
LHGGTIRDDGVNVAVGGGGFAGETVAERATVPLNRLNVLMLIVELAFWPGVIVRVFGLALGEYTGLQNCPF